MQDEVTGRLDVNAAREAVREHTERLVRHGQVEPDAAPPGVATTRAEPTPKQQRSGQ